MRDEIALSMATPDVDPRSMQYWWKPHIFPAVNYGKGAINVSVNDTGIENELLFSKGSA